MKTGALASTAIVSLLIALSVLMHLAQWRPIGRNTASEPLCRGCSGSGAGRALVGNGLVVGLRPLGVDVLGEEEDCLLEVAHLLLEFVERHGRGVAAEARRGVRRGEGA